MSKRIALFTGTFDPFHIAHYWQLSRAQAASNFDEAVIAVIRNNPKKPQAAAWQHRQQLAKLTMAAQDVSFMWRVETIENIKPATVKDFSARHLGSGKPLRVVGADVISEFLEDALLRPSLHEYQYIVVMRPVSILSEVEATVKRIQKLYADFNPQIVEIQQEVGEISARDLRSNIPGSSAQGFILPEILAYIQKHQLYSDQTT
jgi:nicotinate (nicotinamide) nucleotide adenylyltransferase